MDDVVLDLAQSFYYVGLILGALAVLIVWLAYEWLIPLYVRLAVKFLEWIFGLETKDTKTSQKSEPDIVGDEQNRLEIE